MSLVSLEAAHGIRAAGLKTDEDCVSLTHMRTCN